MLFAVLAQEELSQPFQTPVGACAIRARCLKRLLRPCQIVDEQVLLPKQGGERDEEPTGERRGAIVVHLELRGLCGTAIAADTL